MKINILKNKKHLLITVILFNILFIPVICYLLSYIREDSTSLALDFFGILFWFFILVVLSFLETLLLKDILFYRNADEKHFKSYTFYFSLIFIILLILNFLFTNTINNNFWLGYYSKGGIYKTNLRSKNSDKVQWALKKISAINYPYLTDFLPLIEEKLSSQDIEIKREAILTTGKIARRMQRSVGILNTAGEKMEGRWEWSFLKEIKERFSPIFLKMILKDDRKFLSPLAYSLGAMREKMALSYFESFFYEKNFNYDVGKDIILAIADIRDSEGLEIIKNFLFEFPPELQSISFFSAGEIILYSKENDKKVEDFIYFIAKNLSAINSGSICAFLNSFHKIRDIRFTDVFIDIYEKIPEHTQCKRLEIQYPDDYPQPVITEGFLKIKILDSLALISIGNEKLKKWFEEKVEDSKEKEIFHKKIKGIIEAIKKKE